MFASFNRPDWRGGAASTGIRMPFTLVAALAMQASVSMSTPCEKLLTEFARNEVTFTVIDNANQSLLKADQTYANATGDLNVVSRRLRTIADSQKEFADKGDRIIPLLVGQGCPLPDHAASPATFRRDVEICTAAKGTPDEVEACGYIARAVAATMARQTKSKAARRLPR